ncbi:hypothetical protein [Thalassococcus lentus]|uniref:DUF2312 domain-containing protein n=1 Tax=Thalassococcus lentus TaxID=1210524 RepID=A0ABT4XS64_9RHOB|nr:hypothetical protein [Thalassococcus lentus]MDA7424678.1 hypothetical protein [Thalassococcus lentus]
MTNTAQTGKDQVLITAKTEAERLEKERDSIARQLTGLRQQIEALQDQLEAGTIKTEGEDKKLLAELRYWLKAGRETEKEIDEIRRRDAGIADVYGLDLDAAVSEIGCRLARVRACCGAGEVS